MPMRMRSTTAQMPSPPHVEAIRAEHAEEVRQQEGRALALLRVARGGLARERQAVVVPHLAHADEDRVDDRPDPEAAAGEHLGDAEARLAHVEAVGAPGAQEHRQEERGALLPRRVLHHRAAHHRAHHRAAGGRSVAAAGGRAPAAAGRRRTTAPAAAGGSAAGGRTVATTSAGRCTVSAAKVSATVGHCDLLELRMLRAATHRDAAAHGSSVFEKGRGIFSGERRRQHFFRACRAGEARERRAYQQMPS